MVSNRRMTSSYRQVQLLIPLLALLLFTACSGEAIPTGSATPAAVASASESQAASTQPPAVLAETGATEPAATEPALAATQAETAALEPAATDAAVSTAASPALACTAPAELTPAMTEGPYFKAGSPERSSLLEDGMDGTRLVISGYVLTADCQPVANALLDFWQADAQGSYDNTGYRLRGHVFTGPDGRYTIETVVPGEYPGRTEHIHVKVQAPGGPVLTTQLFFPGVQHNESDRIFSDKLLLEIQETPDGVQGVYNFVVAS